MTASPNAKHVQRIVIDLYCRISKDYDGTLRSVEDQEVEGRHAVERLGFIVGKVYRDHALSAYNQQVVRPDFVELMVRIDKGESQGLWVRDLTRFTRRMEEALRIKKAMERGAVLIAAYDPYDISTADGLDKFYRDAVRAEVESKQISDRSSRGKTNKALYRGKSNASWRGFARPGNLPKVHAEGCPGSKMCSCPARDADLIPVPADRLAAEVRAVRLAVKGLLAGTENLAGIARKWNSLGLYTVSGKRWAGCDVRQMLESQSLAGRNVHRGVVVGTLPGEPVIDPETYDRLMLSLSSRKRGRPATAYLLSGLIRCGKCDSPLYGRPLTSRAPYPDGSVARQYWCQVREKEQGGCGTLTIDQRFADACVERMVVARMADPANADRVGRTAAKADLVRRTLLVDLKRLNDEKASYAAKAADPDWTPDMVSAAVAKYRPLIAKVQTQIDALGEPVDADASHAGSLAEAQADWDAATGNVSAQRAMVKRAYPEGLYVLPAGSRGKASLAEERIVPGTRPGRYQRSA